MPDDTILDRQPRGYLRFIEKKTGDTLSIGIGETGAATYQSGIFAGNYDVWFRADTSDDQDVLPPGGQVQLKVGCN